MYLQFQNNKINQFLYYMNNLSSPFIHSIKQCKMTMRKLRKKIYKHSISGKSKVKKSKDNTEEIIDIFKQRDIPQFVTEALRKRRNFDVSSIKNIAISIFLPLEEIQNRTDMQQREANQLYQHHKQRMTQIKNRLALLKTDKNLDSKLHPVGIYSTTEEQGVFSSEELMGRQSNELLEDRDCYQNFESGSKEQICDNYFHLNNMESSLDSQLALFNF